MGVRIKAIYDLTEKLGAREATHVIALSKEQERVEAKWRRRMKKEIEKITEDLLKNAEKTGRLKLSEVDFSSIVMEQSFDVLKQGITSAERKSPASYRSNGGSALSSAPPRSQIPRSLKALRIMWDDWRKKGKMPPRQRSIAEKLRKAYCEKLQSVWEKYGEEFRSGKTASVTAAVTKIQEGAGVVFSRAKMIVETETTYYYNRARREVYDESPDVTHYLFVAIRDHATTKWCKTRQGLVFKKGSSLLDKNTPPCHWNCRSEILPLTPQNPQHRRLIEDKGIKAENRRLEPLPPGWSAR